MLKNNIFEFAKIHNCTNIYSACILFIPGLNNVVSNLYVLLVFDYRDKKILYLVLYHRPRASDVIKLLDNLIDKPSSLLIFIDKYPLNTGKVNTYVENNFIVSKKLKLKNELIGVYEAYKYLQHVLNKDMNNIKNQYSKATDKNLSSPEYFYTSIYVSSYIDVWNAKNVFLINNLMSDYPASNNLNRAVSESVYEFDVDVKENSEL
jgi:hypothetical protein